jgi:hypothetical protein
MGTTRKICSRAKQFFRAAERKRLIAESPFGDMTKLAIKEAKKFLVTREMTDKVLEACVDNQWRLIVVLCRFGGLRCPSEVLALRWGDVNWQHGRLTVHSPKTEHHEGKESRIIPLFPELLPELRAVYLELPEEKFQRLSGESIITRYRKTNANLRTQLERTIKAAGLDPWPVLFNSLRSTRATELRDRFPDHVVNQWMGHTQKVAEKHYLQVTDAHFDAATAPLPPKTAPLAVHHPVPREVTSGTAVQSEEENPEEFEIPRGFVDASAPPVGLERNAELPGKSATNYGCGANRGAPNGEGRATPIPTRHADSDLAYLVNRWPSLPAPARAAVLAVLAAVPDS